MTDRSELIDLIMESIMAWTQWQPKIRTSEIRPILQKHLSEMITVAEVEKPYKIIFSHSKWVTEFTSDSPITARDTVILVS